MNSNFFDSIRNELESWPGEFTENSRLIKVLNSEGKHPPVFWCFQSAIEFKSLSHALGKNTPLFALRSGHLLMDYNDSTIDVLTTKYAEEIRNVYLENPKGIPVLSGNCQGAGLMLHVAKKLEAEGKFQFTVCILESTLPQVINCPVTLIYGRNSSYNLFRRYHSPETALPQFYKKVNIVTMPGGHGRFFTETHVPYLASILEMQHKPRAQVLSLEAPSEYQYNPKSNDFKCDQISIANIKIEKNSSFPNTRIIVNLELKNTPTLPSDHNRFYLSNQWYRNSDKTIYQWLDSCIPIPSNKTGLHQSMSLPVTAPLAPGEYILKFRISEEGLEYKEFENEIPVMVLYAPYCCNITVRINPTMNRKIMTSIRRGCIDQLSKIIAGHQPLTIRQWHLLLSELIRDKRWEDGTILIESLLQQTPLTLSILEKGMNCFTHQKQFQKVIDLYQNSIELHMRKNPLLNQFYLTAIVQEGSVEEAFTMMSESKFSVTEPALVLQQMLKPHVASSSIGLRLRIAEFLEQIDDSLETSLNVSAVFVSAKQFERAQAFLLKGTEKFPHNATLALRAARVNLQLEEVSATRIYYERAISLSPHNPEALEWLQKNSN